MSLDWVWNLSGNNLAVSAALAQWLAVPVGLIALALAAWAAKAAARSAEIASAALKVTESTAKHQLRAYLHHGRATVLSMSDMCPVVEIEIINSGQTPAYAVEVGTQHYFGRPMARADLAGGGSRIRSLGMVGPGQRRCIRIEHIDPVQNQTTKPFLISVIIRWQDIYGENRDEDLTLTCPDLLAKSSFPKEMVVVTSRTPSLAAERITERPVLSASKPN